MVGIGAFADVYEVAQQMFACYWPANEDVMDVGRGRICWYSSAVDSA